jgi:hypothetical protein
LRVTSRGLGDVYKRQGQYATSSIEITENKFKFSVFRIYYLENLIIFASHL